MTDKKKKRGFTLIELTVVMVIAAIVGTMVISFIMIYTQYNNRLGMDTNVMKEITDFKQALNSWATFYDSKTYTIEVSGKDSAQLKANYNVEGSNAEFSSTLVVEKNGDDGIKMIWKKGDKNFRTYKFENLKGITFNWKNTKQTVVSSTVSYKYGNKDLTEEVLQSIFSNTERNRYSADN